MKNSFHNPCTYGNDDCPQCVKTHMPYNKEEVMKSVLTDTYWHCSLADNDELRASLSTALDSAYKAGREEMEKLLREALRMLEDEIPFTGEEVIAKIKEALK